MPRFSVWAIRTALLYLVMGMTIGALMLWHKGMPLHPLLWRLLPAHIEFLLFGWTVQLVLGIAYWILPRFQAERGNPVLVWLALGLLNLGILLVSLAPFVTTPGLISLYGRMAEIAGATAFALHAWPRIKPTGV
jgi:heme/copper-type cytochrome/quinol oxidase subunit 1